MASVLVLGLMAIPACDDDDGGSTPSDTGTTDTGSDTGGPDSTVDCNTQCFTALPSAGTNPRVVLESVQYDPVDVVILKNISGSTVDFNGWQICHEQTCAAIGSVSVSQSAKLTINLNESGTNTSSEVFIDTFADLSGAGEIAIYNSDDFASSSAIMGFVRWGNPGGTGSRATVAVSGDEWEGANVFVPTCAEHDGLVAVGNVTLERGWKALPSSCW